LACRRLGRRAATNLDAATGDARPAPVAMRRNAELRSSQLEQRRDLKRELDDESIAHRDT
jgi:hypothetical protein